MPKRLICAPIVRPLAWNYPDDPICLGEKTAYEMVLGRVGQKCKDAPQICEVNIPKDAKTLTFSFVQEGDVKAGGFWKNLKLVK